MWHGLAWLFGCTHHHLTFPQTPRRGQQRPSAAALTGTYVVCLDCGKEFGYDLEHMQVVFDPKRHNAVLTTHAHVSPKVA